MLCHTLPHEPSSIWFFRRIYNFTHRCSTKLQHNIYHQLFLKTDTGKTVHCFEIGDEIVLKDFQEPEEHTHLEGNKQLQELHQKHQKKPEMG